MGSAKKGPHILEAADNKVVFSLTFLCRDLQKKKNPNGKKVSEKMLLWRKNRQVYPRCLKITVNVLYQEYVSCVI